MTLTTLSIRRATNLFGPLSPDIRARLEAVINDPTEATWDDAYSIILNRERFTTLWQAVIAVDPTFPRTGPVHSLTAQVSGWPQVPTRDILLAAIEAAVRS